MSGVSGWDARDVKAWRGELEEASKGDETTRAKALTLVTAAMSYVAACSWIGVVKKLGCPGGTDPGAELCAEMKPWEMILFSGYVLLFTIVVATVCYGMYTAKNAMDARIQDAAKQRIKSSSGADLTQTTSAAARQKDQINQEARLASLAQGKTFDLVAGNTVYACVVMWTITLHSFTSYTTISGVWTYFAMMMLFCCLMTVLSFEAAPVVGSKLRSKVPAFCRSGVDSEKNNLVLVARAFGGAMAWLLAVALIHALEVTMTRNWPGGKKNQCADSMESSCWQPCYYSGYAHNIPLVGRFILCFAVVGLMVPVLTLLKRSKKHMLRDNLVQALMDRGDWDLAAFTMRAWDRLRGLCLPTLSFTAAQALLRAFEKFLTPHAWEIFTQPEDLKVLLGGNNKEATAAANDANTNSLINSGVNQDVANSWSDGLAQLTNATATSPSDAVVATQKVKNSVAAGNAALDRGISAACKAATSYQCSFDNDESDDFVNGGTCLTWLFNTNGFMGWSRLSSLSSVGTCATSTIGGNCDAWDAAVAAAPEKYTGAWGTGEYNTSKVLCEQQHCTFSNGTEFFGAFFCVVYCGSLSVCLSLSLSLCVCVCVSVAL